MAQRELRYGDIIHLSTNTGVVGSFYPFPFLNQLLVLDTEGPGIQQSQALWCNFIVLPPYALVNEIYFVAPGPGRHNTLTLYRNTISRKAGSRKAGSRKARSRKAESRKAVSRKAGSRKKDQGRQGQGRQHQGRQGQGIQDRGRQGQRRQHRGRQDQGS